MLDVALGKREDITIFGTDYDTPDGTCIRDYIHVEDLAIAHIKALIYLKTNGSNVFNLGNRQGYSVREIIQAAEKIANNPIKAVEVLRRQGDPAILIGGIEKAKKN